MSQPVSMIKATVIDPGAKSFLTDVLSHACPWGSGEPDADGFLTYRVEVHCVEFFVRAKNTAPLGWVVADWSKRDC